MKKVKNTLYIIFLLLAIFGNKNGLTQSSTTILEKSSIIENFENKQKQLLVGVREDSYPIAYREDGEWRGFCIDLSNKLSKYIQDKLNTNNNIEPEYIATNRGDFRFQFVKEKKVHLECGPNSIFNPQNLLFSDEIKKRYEGVDFSNPFFETGARLILKAKNKNNIKENFSLNPKYFDNDYPTIITTIENTTTELLIKSIYQSYEQTYHESDNRNTGFRAVINDEAFAFAIDSIILEAALERGRLGGQEINKNEYTLFPENSFLSYESYGIVVDQNEQEWKKFINNFLNTKEVKTLIKTQLTDKYENPKKISEKQIKNIENDIWSSFAQLLPWLLLLIFTLIIIIRLIYFSFKILKLEFDFKEEFDWNVFFETLNELQANYLDLRLHNIKLREQKNNKIVVDVKVPRNKNKSAFTQEFISLYQSKILAKNKGAVGTIKISTRLIWESLVRANVGEIVRRIWF